MKARMDKYQDSNSSSLRSEKNKRLYDEVSDMNIDYVDINTSNVMELTGGSSGARENYKRQRELNHIIPSEKKTKVYEELVKEKNEDRVYDINEILKLARENKLFGSNDSKKRIINTEYNILTKLDLDEVKNNDYSKENLHDLIDTIYEKEKKNKSDVEKDIPVETENTDMFSFIKDDTTDVDLNEEVSKNILEKEETKETINTSSLDDDTKEESEEKEDAKDKAEETTEMTDTMEFEEVVSKKTIFIIIFVLLLLGVVIYVLLKYFNVI